MSLVILGYLGCIKKDVAFIWGEKQEKALEILKHKLEHKPILALPDFTKTFEIECDAFGVGIYVVLIQGGNPIPYFNEKN